MHKPFSTKVYANSEANTEVNESNAMRIFLLIIELSFLLNIELNVALRF